MLFSITKAGVLGKAPESKWAAGRTEGMGNLIEGGGAKWRCVDKGRWFSAMWKMLSKIRRALSLFNDETREGEHKR
jgi:hypothetical protein